MIDLSIIIPTYNEMKFDCLNENLKNFSMFNNVEIICVDSYSNDGTEELIDSFNCTRFSLKTNLRSVRLNHGIKNAKASFILLCHPRSKVDIEGIKYLLDKKDQLVWGGFHHRFDCKGWGLKFTSWYSNNIRAKICSNLYLDHCIFFNKALYSKTGAINSNDEFMPNVSIFEDTLLSYKLRNLAPATMIDYYSTTSAIRFIKNGFVYQALLNQVLKVLFYFGVSDTKMNRFYEKNLSLNSSY